MKIPSKFFIIFFTLCVTCSVGYTAIAVTTPNEMKPQNLGPIQPPNFGKIKGKACSSSWQPIFKGNSEREPGLGERPYRQLTVDQNIDFSDLERLIKEGCDFKVVNVRAAGGGSNTILLYCQRVDISSTGAFICNGGNFSPEPVIEGTPLEVVSLVLDNERNVFYFDNVGGHGFREVTIFARN